jgi:putative hydrolase of the HAD superfamily
MIKALVFDLDDTLYLESDFVESGYRAVAQHLARQYGCCCRDVFYAMMSVFVNHGRENVFPTIIRRFLANGVSLSELVEVYRSHTPRIRLFSGYGELLRELRESYRLGIITDGPPEVQRRKVRALGLEQKVDRVIYTWEHGAEKQKPHPQPFSLMMDSLKSRPFNTLYIGDNREKDCKGAHGVGMKFIQVQIPSRNGHRSESASADEADYVVESLYQLPQILQSTDRT